jgi:hypothetical protein
MKKNSPEEPQAKAVRSVVEVKAIECVGEVAMFKNVQDEHV